MDQPLDLLIWRMGLWFVGVFGLLGAILSRL